MERMRPILFNTEMVKAILEGRKTQTRRVIRPSFRDNESGFQIIRELHSGRYVRVEYYDEYEDVTRYMSEPCQPGDILYVRETWCDPEPDNYMVPVFYKADMPLHWDAEDTEHGEAVDITADEFKWHPSIHMPKEFARIFLSVKDVRAEHLNDMCEENAIAEGFPDSPAGTDSPLERFATLWDKTIKPADRDDYGWYANPWVWVIEFERCEKPEGWCG